jgi:hypothetical protein
MDCWKHASFGALIILLVAGCARTVWTKPGATTADFERDKSACTFEAARGGDAFVAAMFLPDCLRGRGWKQVRE